MRRTYTVINHKDNFSKQITMTEEQAAALEQEHDFCVIPVTTEAERQAAMVVYGD